MPSDRLSNRPVYLRLRDDIVARVAASEWMAGKALPSESDLAREYGVSPGTMRKALDTLERERVLVRRQGRGTFVTDGDAEELAARFTNIRNEEGRRLTGEIASTELAEDLANEVECARLQLGPEDRVYRIRRVRTSGGEAFMAERAVLPAALFPGLAEKRDHSYRTVALAKTYGVLLGRAQERVTIGAPSAWAAKVLGLAEGSPVLVLDRVVMTLEGRPAEWRIGECRTQMPYLADMV